MQTDQTSDELPVLLTIREQGCPGMPDLENSTQDHVDQVEETE